MQHKGFNYQHYLTLLSEQLRNIITDYPKLYLEITGNLIDQSNITALIPQFEADTYKRLFAPRKYEMDILLCIKAQDIIDNPSMGDHQMPFRDFLQIYLKKVENQFGVKPQIVINLIDIENMYDVIFSFETQFQKLGYKVWEKYKIRAYSHDIQQVISEDGFGNDDHIPLPKKLTLIAGLTPECGKLTIAIAQMYLDQEIDIEAGYAKLEVLPNYAAPKNHPLNVMARAQYLEKAYLEEFDSTLEQIDLYERGLEKHTFIQKVFKILKKPVPEYLSDYIFGQIDDSEMDQEALKQTAQIYIKKLIAQAKHPELSEKLTLLLNALED
ncbi:MAG: DUF1846 family protein [Candidatus Peribacteria bacterium]|jgi:uncharacterized protein (UPF0371 family)|nr:DUF1846 family protein [Candidatus Peribacteria bacterium]